MKIVLKRIYDAASPSDGYRVLIDRLWPRGITKEKAHLSEWNKNLAPSKELRIWYHHNPALWDDFSEKYRTKLKHNNYCKEFLDHNKQQEIITLLYAAHDTLHTHALILQTYLQDLYQQYISNNR
ncbi:MULTISPECIES: DUF488 domain-containing protein [Sphingobacterium]|uniref:DUF488 domain-containing protein n=1 Tax=Sphingobacterium TaxID=28453 RepID=UPI002579C18A|nr:MULTISPECIES: DUF488 family protein [Sphingobacterium]